MAEKENDPDELAELDIEPEQAIKEVLDEEDDEDEKDLRPTNSLKSVTKSRSKYSLRTSVRSTVNPTETDRCDSRYLAFLR
jgi:hypothetical protein